MALYTAAFVCQNALEEKDGVFSAIRLADRVEAEIPADHKPSEIHAPVPLVLMVLLKSEEPQEFRVTVTVTLPSGTTVPVDKPYAGTTKAGTAGHTLRIQVVLDLGLVGIYWFNIHTSDGSEPATKVPFEIVHNLASPTASQSPPQS